MADFSKLIDSIVEVAKAAAPLIGPGAPQAVALGERVVDMIDHAEKAFLGKLPPELPEQREYIEERIRLHVEQTAARLRAEGGE